MATARALSSQTRNPARERLAKDTKRHYVLVENKDNDFFDSPLESYLDQPSYVGNDSMYKVESEDRKVTGSSRFTLLSCSAEDYNAMMRENDRAANLQETRPDDDPETSTTFVDRKGETHKTAQQTVL